MSRFIGTVAQVPPMHSALKRDGQPLYKLAREGTEVERAPRQITVHQMTLVERCGDAVVVDVDCSKGTMCESWPKTSDERSDAARI